LLAPNESRVASRGHYGGSSLREDDGFLCGFFGMLFVGLPYLIGSGEF